MLRMVSYPHRPQSGHITCYLNRTYHVLPTALKLVPLHAVICALYSPVQPPRGEQWPSATPVARSSPKEQNSAANVAQESRVLPPLRRRSLPVLRPPLAAAAR